MALKVLGLLLLIGYTMATHHKHEEHHHPHPFHFGYDIKDHYGFQYRKEQGDGHGTVKGSYGFRDKHGIYRAVNYVADKHGFRAEIKTNEPGTDNQDPANVKMLSHASHHHYLQHQDHHGRHRQHYG